MAITPSVCDSYLQEIMEGVHTATDEYKIALFTSDAGFDSSTTEYTTENEIVSAGYTSGGQVLQGFETSIDAGSAVLDFTVNPLWSGISVDIGGAMIYNASKNNAALVVFAFTSFEFPVGVNPAGGDFEIVFPAPTAETGLIVIS